MGHCSASIAPATFPKCQSPGLHMAIYSERLGTMNPNESQRVAVNCRWASCAYARIEARVCGTLRVEMTPQRFESYQAHRRADSEVLMLKAVLVAVAFLATVAAAPAPTASFAAGSVHVDQYGSGTPALVLIPGLTDLGKVWDSTVARYQGSHAIYVLTLPGFGGQPKVAAPLLDTVVRDIAAFLPRTGKPVVIGHSLGGILAIRLAEEHSDLIAGAVAVDGLPVFAGLDNQTAQARAAISAKRPAELRRFRRSSSRWRNRYKSAI